MGETQRHSTNSFYRNRAAVESALSALLPACSTWPVAAVLDALVIAPKGTDEVAEIAWYGSGTEDVAVADPFVYNDEPVERVLPLLRSLPTNVGTITGCSFAYCTGASGAVS